MDSSSPAPMHRHKRGPRRRPPDSSPRPVAGVEPPDNLFPSGGECLRLVSVLVIAVVVAYTCSSLAAYFRSTTSPTKKPFCDTQFLGSPDSPQTDFCEPCPENGECFEGGLECASGYRKLGSTCVEDGEVDERAKKLLRWVENHLCGSYAQFLCYGTGIIWVPEEDIWKDVDKQQLLDIVGADEASFLYTKNRTMETIGKSLETRTSIEGIKEFKCPELVAEHYKPFSCRIRLWILKRVAIIVPACVMIMVLLLLFTKARRSWYMESRAEQLYQQICDILEENALASRGLDGHQGPWAVASRLRDHLLLPKERKQSVLWKKVEELVQEDSRIDIYPKLVKGESKVVWEWQVEGSLSSERLRKKGGEVRKFNSFDGSEATRQRQLRHALQTEAKTPML